MNATLFDGGKVHRVIDAAARCGVDKVRKRSQWQMDFGEVTCGRCRRLEMLAEGAETIPAGEAIGNPQRDSFDSRLGLIGLQQYTPGQPCDKG